MGNESYGPFQHAPGAGAPVTIYALIDPRTGEPRYVGKTSAPLKRLAGHLSDARCGGKSPKAHWLRELLASGLAPEMQVLEEVEPGDWRAAEQRWAERLAGALLNSTRPGGGPDSFLAAHLRPCLGERGAIAAELERARQCVAELEALLATP